jgi:hypothetical protein
MAIIFENIILNKIENSKKKFSSFFCLVRLLKERIDQNAKRKVCAIVESVRERERERERERQ